jgi:hypothetical protein
MRVKQNGERWFMDLSAQEQTQVLAAKGKLPPTPRQAWLSLTRRYLGDVDLFARQSGVGDAVPVTTVRAALRLLIEYLEKTR